MTDKLGRDAINEVRKKHQHIYEQLRELYVVTDKRPGAHIIKRITSWMEEQQSRHPELDVFVVAPLIEYKLHGENLIEQALHIGRAFSHLTYFLQGLLHPSLNYFLENGCLTFSSDERKRYEPMFDKKESDALQDLKNQLGSYRDLYNMSFVTPLSEEDPDKWKLLSNGYICDY